VSIQKEDIRTGYFLSNDLRAAPKDAEVSHFFTICASVRDARIVFPAPPQSLLMRCTFLRPRSSRRSLSDVATACTEIPAVFCSLCDKRKPCQISCRNRANFEIKRRYRYFVTTLFYALHVMCFMQKFYLK